MKKQEIKEKIRSGAEALWRAVKAHPVEIVILLYVCVVGCYGMSHPKVLDGDDGVAPWWFRPMVLAPFMVVAAYSLQPLRKRGIGWLLLYLLPLAGMVAGFAMPFLIDWTEGTTYWIAACVALPLWMCVRHRLTDNEPFVRRNVQMAWSAARALLIAGILYLLYAAIVYTIKSLFDIPHKTWDGWYEQAALLLFCGLAPVLFFAMEDRPAPVEIRRFWAVLLNWVLTPALLIYTVVLYVYAAKILFTWNLPKGGVAIMVTVFFVVFLLTKMLQMLTEPQPFKWFYDRFGLFVLPLLALFWTGVARRLADYGLTESRYYLLLVGALMTACVLVFLFRNRRGYFALAAGALAVVLLTVLVPGLRGERIAQRAQIQRVRTIATQLDRLNDDGTLRLPEPDPADTLQMVEHRRLYQSLDYLDDRNDTVLLKSEFGIARKSDYLASLSEKTSKYASAWSEELAREQLEEEVVIEEIVPSVYLSRKTYGPVDVSGYRQMYGTPNPANADEQLSIGNGRNISANQIFREQLQRLGCPDVSPSRSWIKDHEDELLIYRTDSLLVCFNKLELKRMTSDSVWEVSYFDWVMLVK
ncbi:MAG: DUF4153 domain-containing protein [Bacteroidales bacterium]|nr:DUF4153 domain-containing protein [Bacteroidales bacterium]